MTVNMLVVDDSPVMRKMVRRSLGMAGLPIGEIFEAGDGRGALTLLDECWVDLVFADINMPEMNGIELVERMAADAVLAKIPVVVISTERSEARIERLKQAGIRAYVGKPFTPEDFRRVVHEVLALEVKHDN